MYSKIKQFLDAAPTALKSANEIYNFARNAYKQAMGVFPDGLDNVFLKRGAAEMQDVRQKVVKFPEGGKDKTDFFTTRPDPRVKQPKGAKMDIQRANENLAGGSNYADGDTKYNADVLGNELAIVRGFIKEGQDATDMDPKQYSKLYDEAYSYLTQLRMLNRKPRRSESGIPTTIEGKTKNMSAEEIMDFLMNKGKGKDTNIGTAPKTTKTKPKVDPELQAMDDQNQMFENFSTRNLTGIEAMKEASSLIGRKGKYKNISESDAKTKLDELQEIINKADGDPDALAQGGRIGFSEGSRREFDPSNFIEKMTQDMIKKSPDGIVMDPTNRVEDLTTADRPTKPKIKAEPFDPYDPNAPFYFNQDRPELSQTLVYDDGTIYYKDTGEYYNIETGVQVPGPSKGAKPVPKTLEAASGGRIGFSGGGAGFAGDPMEGDQYTMGQQIPGSPQVPMGEFGPVNVGIFGGGGYSKNQIVPGVDMATTNQNYGITTQIPIGNTGFTIGGDYMKSRVNDRFTGDAIPGQTYKSVPTDSDTFNVGINFRKQFKDGSKPPNPGRRTFMKTMAGLASLPFVGKLFKPAAKVAEAGPAIAEGVKLGFDKFVMLVNKIKSIGKKTDAVTQKEREVGYVYKGKDGSEYELVEDLTTGDIRVTKDKPGFMSTADDTIETIEDRSTFVLRRNQADETTKGKKPADEYDEMKEVPSRDGTFDDIDEVDDNTVREILEELKETKIKKAGGGLAYMLGE